MELLNKEIDNNLNNIISIITNNDDYKKCIELKKIMDKDKVIKDLVKNVKILQKKYIRNNYDDDIKKELDDIINKLNKIPLYVIYNNSLEKVNLMISTVNDEINNYFYDKLNKNINF